jgi:serine/threonine protein phosphatase PrpC
MPQWRIEVCHDGLGKRRVITGNDKFAVAQKADEQHSAWEDEWSALTQTRDAQTAIRELQTVLKDGLAQDHSIRWGDFKQPFPEPPPRLPPVSKLPPEPQPFDPEFTLPIPPKPDAELAEKIIDDVVADLKVHPKRQTPARPAVLPIVCDGFSNSRRRDEASLAAVQASVRVLLAGVRADEDLTETSQAAVAAAQQALAGLDEPGPGDPPSATFVSAVMTTDTVTLCWLGDSRAYWLGSGTGSDAKRLTRDDSVAGEMVAAGLVSEADAMALPGAHVVTGWVGADSPGAPPHVATFTPPGPGVLLLCSDGLWNYQPEAAGLAGLALPGALSDLLGTAAALVKFALEAGGADNITAVLALFPPTAPKPEEKPADER